MLHLQSLNNKVPARKIFALCAVLICSMFVNSTIVEAGPNRAIQRAVQSNALQALKRIRLEPRVKPPWDYPEYRQRATWASSSCSFLTTKSPDYLILVNRVYGQF